MYRNPSRSRSREVDQRRYRKEAGGSRSKRKQVKEKSKSYLSHKQRDCRTDTNSDSDDTPPPKKNWGLVTHDGKQLPLHKNPQENEPKKSHVPDKPIVDTADDRKNKRKLTEKEKEEKRKEMMQDAQWRDRERAKNVKKYRENDSKEASKQDYNPEFIHKELLKASNASSVESRIKSNVNNIQRSAGYMDKNFSRRN